MLRTRRPAATPSWRVLTAALGIPLLLAGCTGGGDDMVATPAPTGSPVTTLVHLSDVRAGMCVDTTGLPEDGRSAYLQVSDCAGTHDAEVFHVLEGDADPATCTDFFEEYVGTAPDASDLEIRAVQDDGRAPESARSVGAACLAVSPEQVVGSVGATNG